MSLFQTREADPEARPERAGGRVVWVVVAGLAVLLAGGYVAAYLVAGDKVPRGTTVAGVDIGGQDQDAAVADLRRGLADRLEQPVTVDVNGETREVTPEQAGLTVDLEASVAEAGGERSWSPGRLWDYFTGGDDLDAVVDVDDDAMAAAVERLNDELGTPPRDGSWTFTSGRPREVEPEVGRGLDGDVTRDAIVAAYLSDEPTATVELTDVAPEIDAADMDRAREDFVNPAMSGPVTLVFGKSEVLLRPRQFVRALTLTPEAGELVPGVDEERVGRLVDGVTGRAGRPVDATVELVNGKPKVVPAKPGVTFEPAQVADVLLEVVSALEGEREAEVEATVDEPEFSTADARALRIRERVSTFTTYFPYAEYRNTNIGRAAELVDGTVLKPGEVFSLNETVGERTAENGFVPGFVISDGIFREDYGGGVSQMATTLFNAMFFAGLKDIEHKPHSFYIDRYPVGREATVAWGSLDLRFQNDTPYGVLIDAEVTPSTPSSQGVATVRMYSTKHWDIDTRTSERYAYVGPGTRILDTPDCYPNSGYSGFQIDVWRIFRRAGESAVVKEEKFHTSYTPSDTVICRPPGSVP